jgi:hypothetical protein
MRPPRALAPAAALALLASCSQALAVSHTETPCVTAGQTATVTVTTEPGATVSFKVQDDFGGDLGAIGPVTAAPDGKATVTWKAPATLSTTTLHFILSAVHADKRAGRDIHVVVGGNGRSC